jgi:HAD superfamily hydrolase (TIGR01549 family)
VPGLALFDLDNTLADRAAAFGRWSERFVTQRGLGSGALEFLVAADEDGLATREAFFDAVRREFAINDPVDELIARYRTEYPREYDRRDEPTLAALRRLRDAGWRVGIVTNGPATQEEKIRLSGLAEVVDAVCVSELVGATKPERAIFEEAARRCAVPLHGWMIGDSATADVGGGIAVGLRTAWLARGRTWPEPAYRPDVIVQDVPEAVQAILAADDDR